MHVGRRRREQHNPTLVTFYTQLISRLLPLPSIRDGTFAPLRIAEAWQNNPTFNNFLAFFLQHDTSSLLVVINYGGSQGQCYVKFDGHLDGEKRDRVKLRDVMSHVVYERSLEELKDTGLYLDMPQWGYHVFSLE